jgi:ankyrin repeat protein
MRLATKCFSAVIILVGVLIFSGCRSVSSQKLQDAAEIGDLNQVKLLLQNGANVNSTDNRGRTPLYIASLGGKSNVASYLLDHGADPNKGASWKGNQRPLHVAAMYDHVSIIQNLLRHGAKIDSCTSAGETPLHYAAWHGRSSAVKFLLEEGANPNAKDIYGNSALHFPFTQQDVNILNGSSLGIIPTNFKEVTVLLILVGTDVNAPAKKPYYFTPLMDACAVAPIDVVDYLLSNGANAEAKTETGVTAYSIAKSKKRNDVVELLQSRVKIH